jgi:RHS repeat-associated protein
MRRGFKSFIVLTSASLLSLTLAAQDAALALPATADSTATAPIKTTDSVDPVAAKTQQLGTASEVGAKDTTPLLDPKSALAPAGKGDAPDVETALAWARELHKRVRVHSLLTETTAVYVNADGTRTMDLSKVPQRVRVDGDWQELDTDLAPEDGAIAPDTTAVPIAFAGDATDPLLTVGSPTASVAIDKGLVDAAPTLDGSTATYDDAIGPGQSVELQALPNGAELSVVLDSPPTGDAEWRFPLTLTGLRPSGEDGRTLVDSKNAAVLQVSQGVAFDATPEGKLAVGRRESALSTHIEDGTDGLVLVMVAAPDFLTDPATKYPVTIDPTISSVVAADTYVNASSAVAQGSATGLLAGYDPTNHATDRALIAWNVGSLTNQGITVTSATANLYQYGSQSCTGKTTNLYRVTQNWNPATLVWGTPQPTVTATALSSDSSAICAGWVSFSGSLMNSMVQGWVDQTLANQGVELKASNEADTLSARGFYSSEFATPGYAPYLSITYTTNNPTVTPQAVTAVTGAAQAGTGAFTAGQEVQYNYTLSDPTTAPMVVSASVPTSSYIVPGSVRIDNVPCSTPITCTISGTGIAVSGVQLVNGTARSLKFTAVAAPPSSRICGQSPITASATTSVGGLGSGIGSMLVCGSGLGNESWWTSRANTVTGPQGGAAFNVASGNLVVTQTDGTVIPARGHLAYVLRRTYNSQDVTTGLELPGQIGAGWVLNTGSLSGAEGAIPAGLVIPPSSTLLNPLALTLVDRDGTRHTFTPKAVGATVGIKVANWNAANNVFDGLGLGALVPQALTANQEAASTPRFSLKGGSWPTVCANLAYKAPPGVHLSVWRYLATTGSNCASLTDSNAMLIGYAALRPDRLRTEYAWDGKLVSMQDGSGAEMRYAYGSGLPDLPLAPGASLPVIKALSAMYEPKGCQVHPDPVSLRLRVDSYPICRKAEFSYSFDADSATRCPLPGNPAITIVTCVLDAAGRTTKYNEGLDGGTQLRLLSVENPDGSILNYTYAKTGAMCGSATVGQLCSLTDPKGVATSFEYMAAPSWAGGTGPAWVSKITDRRNAGAGTPTTLSYPSSTETVTTRGSRVLDDKSIDSIGQVGESLTLNDTSGVYNDTVYTWDSSATCTEPLGNAPNPVDRNLCTVVRKQIAGAGAPDSTEAFRYNPDGYEVADSQALGSATLVSTTGYTTQYADLNGTRSAYTDSLPGGGVVTHGGGTRPAPDAVLYTISDRTSSLSARGNAAGPTGYLTTYTVDNIPGVAPNTQNGTVCGILGVASGNTGLVCEVSAPSPVNDGTQAKTRYQYNENGSRTRMTTPRAVLGGTCAGGSGTYTYDYFVPGETDLSSYTSSYDWLKGVTDPCGKFIAYGYDRAGNIVRTWDRNATSASGLSLTSFPGTLSTPPANAPYSETLYGSSGEFQSTASPWRYPLVVKDAVGAVTAFCRDANGNATTQRGARAASPLAPVCSGGAGTYDTVNTYGLDDQLASTKAPAEATATSFGYDSFGQRTSVTRPGPGGVPLVTVTKYDAAGRATKTRWTRSAAGNDTTPNNPDAACTPGTLTASADSPLPSGRVLCESSSLYDGHNNVTDSYDAAGGHTAAGYDALDRQMTSTAYRTATAPLVTRRTYDYDGNVADVCSPRDVTEGQAGTGSTCTGNYSVSTLRNAVGQPTQVISRRVPQGTLSTGGTPTVLTTALSYDADGNQVSALDPNGTGQTSRTYDLLDRATTQTVARGSSQSNITTFIYTPSGDQASISAPAPAGSSRVTAYSYDPTHRVVDTVIGASNTDASLAGVASSDGGSNTRTRSFYDAAGNTVARLTPNAFRTSVTSPETHYLERTNYDADNRPVAGFKSRSSDTLTAPAALSNSDCNPSKIPTGTVVTAAGQPAVPNFPALTDVCSTTASYDEASRLKTVTPATGSTNSTSFTYTDDDLRATVVAPNPVATDVTNQTVSTNYQYDGAGRLTLVKLPQQTISVTHNNLDGTVKDTWAPLTPQDTTARITNYSYNADGQTADVVDALGQTTHTEYNSDGTVALASDSTYGSSANAQNITKYSYDKNGNTTSVFSPSANTADPTDTTNDAGAPTKNTYAYDNLLLSTEVPSVVAGTALTQYRRIDYAYDEGGRRTSAHTYLEDVSGSTVTPKVGGDAGTQSSSYYNNDRTKIQTGRSGETINTNYEPAGGPTTITQNDGTNVTTLTMSYYLDGLQRTVDDGGAGARTTGYGYTGDGMVTGRSDTATAGGTSVVSTYTYNRAGLPASSTEPGVNASAITYSYDTDGRQTQALLPSTAGTVKVDSGYNTDNSLATQTATRVSDSTTLASYGYTYDGLQRVHTQTFDGQAGPGGGTPDKSTYTYSYDTAGRVSHFIQGTTDRTATYDHDNNRTAYDGTAFTYNSDNSIKTKGGLAYSYQPFGGVLNDQCNTYTYDGFDRELTSTPNGTTCPATQGTASYRYDGLDRQVSRTYSIASGRAVASVPTAVHYDGDSSTISREVISGKSDLTYTLDADSTANGVADAQASTTQYLVDDGNGTVGTTLATTGSVGCTARFDAFGSSTAAAGQTCSTGSTSNDMWFAGEHKDSLTGNYQMGGRTYSPGNASFQQPDSFAPGSGTGTPSSGGDPLVANTYSYVNGDPVNLADPSGHRPMCPDNQCYANDRAATAIHGSAGSTGDFLGRYARLQRQQWILARDKAQAEADKRGFWGSALDYTVIGLKGGVNGVEGMVDQLTSDVTFGHNSLVKLGPTFHGDGLEASYNVGRITTVAAELVSGGAGIKAGIQALRKLPAAIRAAGSISNAIRGGIAAARAAGGLAAGNTLARLKALPEALRASNFAEGNGAIASRLRMLRADPERGSIGGQWPVPTASNCRQCANEIQNIIGGEQAVISPGGSGLVLGPSANNPAGDWFEHVVVLKNNMVFDGFTGRAGMSVNDFKSQFRYSDAINFGF